MCLFLSIAWNNLLLAAVKKTALYQSFPLSASYLWHRIGSVHHWSRSRWSRTHPNADGLGDAAINKQHQNQCQCQCQWRRMHGRILRFYGSGRWRWMATMEAGLHTCCCGINHPPFVDSCALATSCCRIWGDQKIRPQCFRVILALCWMACSCCLCKCQAKAVDWLIKRRESIR